MLGQVNWKTTLIGMALAAVNYLGNALQTGDWTDWKTIVVSALMAAFGYLAKDAGISGTAK